MHSMQSIITASLSRVPQQCCSLQEEPISCMVASAWSHPDRAAVGWSEACVLVTWDSVMQPFWHLLLSGWLGCHHQLAIYLQGKRSAAAKKM